MISLVVWSCLMTAALAYYDEDAEFKYVEYDYPNTLTSPNYPSPYKPNTKIIWMFAQTTPKDRLILTFTDFHLDPCVGDTVTLRSGTFDSERPPLVGVYCGNGSTKGDPSKPKIGTFDEVGTYGNVFLEFYSNAKTEGTGFRLTYAHKCVSHYYLARAGATKCFWRCHCRNDVVCDGVSGRCPGDACAEGYHTSDKTLLRREKRELGRRAAKRAEGYYVHNTLLGRTKRASGRPFRIEPYGYCQHNCPTDDGSPACNVVHTLHEQTTAAAEPLSGYGNLVIGCLAIFSATLTITD